MSNALNFFLDEEQVITGLDFPDTGIDYVFMLSKKDWNVLTTEWDSRSDLWKEGITYFAGFIPLNETSPIILKALYQKVEVIITQALFSIHQSLTEQFDETDELPFIFEAKDKQKIIQELNNRKKDFNTFPELEKLKDILAY